MARWDRAALIFLLLLNRLIRVFFSALIAFHMKIDTFSLSSSLAVDSSHLFRHVNSPSSCWHPPAPFRPSCRPARVSWTTRGTWAPPWVPAKSPNEIFFVIIMWRHTAQSLRCVWISMEIGRNLFSSFFFTSHLDKLGWILLRFSKQPHHDDAALRCCAGLTSVMRLSWTIFTFAEKILYDRFFFVSSLDVQLLKVQLLHYAEASRWVRLFSANSPPVSHVDILNSPWYLAVISMQWEILPT